VHDFHRSGVFGDAVDHAVVASSRRVEANQFGTEGFAYPSWIVGQGPEDELDESCGDLLRQLLQIPFRSSRDSDRVRSAHSGDPVAGLELVVVSESAGAGVGQALADGFGSPRSAEDLQGLLDGSEVVGGDEDRGYLAPGARFLFDVFNPSVRILAEADGVRRTRESLSFTDPDFVVAPLEIRSIFPQELPLLVSLGGLRLVERRRLVWSTICRGLAISTLHLRIRVIAGESTVHPELRHSARSRRSTVDGARSAIGCKHRHFGQGTPGPATQQSRSPLPKVS